MSWLIAVLLALVGQYELTPRGAIGGAGGVFGLALVFYIVGAAGIDRIASLPNPLTKTSELRAGIDHKSGRQAVVKNATTNVFGRILLVGGMALGGVAVFSVAQTGSSSLGLPLWLASMVVVAAGIWTLARFPLIAPRSRDEWLELVGVLALIGVAFGFRFVSLSSIPADVHGDEAAVGIEARRILTGDATDLFRLGWASLPELSFALSSLTLRAVGDNLFGLRMASVIQGALSVGLLYGVMRQLFSARLAFMSSAMLAVSQMAIHYGRIGNNYVQALFASLLFTYFLLRGLSDGHPLNWLLAGFAAGFALSVYYPSRLILVIGILYGISRTRAERGFLQKHLGGLGVLLLGGCLFFAPQVVWYAHDPGSALARASGVFVLSSDNLNHEFSAYGVHSVGDVLLRQFANSVAAFNLRGETSGQYQQTAPLMDFWSGALFVIGGIVATLRARSSRYLLLASWFWLTLLAGSVLTTDALFSPRVVAILAVTAVFPALILETGWRGAAAVFGARGNRIAGVIAVAFLALVGYSNYVGYFVVHAQTMELPNFFTNLANYVAPLNDRYRIYLLANADTSLRYDTAHFLIPNVDGVDVRAWPLPMPLDRIPAEKGVIFVDTSQTDPRLSAIEGQYPTGVLAAHAGPNGFVQFYSYQVEHADLVTANPRAAIDHAPIPALNLTELPATH